MKVKIELDDTVTEEEVIIRCRELTSDVMQLQRVISGIGGSKVKISFYKENVEYFLPLDSILFFETSGGAVDAHTAAEVFQVKLKLYELEEILPKSFVRVSKSAILNTSLIYSIDKNITSSSLVSFCGTHKTMYVSRGYYKLLIQRLDELRYGSQEE